MLSKRYGWKPRFESVDFNPYLDDYYKDIKRWSFPMEVFFLKERFKDLIEISESKDDIIQDRSIYEGVYVFTASNYAMGNLDERDYRAPSRPDDLSTGTGESPCSQHREARTRL